MSAVPTAPRLPTLVTAAAAATVALAPGTQAGTAPRVERGTATAEHVPPVGRAFVDTNTECGPPAADPVQNGKDVVVRVLPVSFTVGRIPATWWKRPPYGDVSWQMRLRGFTWLQRVAQRARVDGQTQSLDALVDQVLAFHRQNPDPGTSRYGWDEGTALRRLGAENCLYSLTKDARLVPVMQADVAVQYGWRFYGPPRWPVHNHGVMADLAVLRAADLLGRRDWRARSIKRLVSEAPLAWTRGGSTREQASTYHVVNVRLWGEVADVLQAHAASTPTLRSIRDLVARATRVAAWLTEPDGRLVAIGESTPEPGRPRRTWAARTFRDDEAGLVVGRWSWADPLTTYYTIRYGPRRWMHGQQDRAGITWSTYGRRVLVGPGKAPYDPRGAYRAWATGASSHNVATVDHRSLDAEAAVDCTAGTIGSSEHHWTTVDRLYGLRHARQISIIGPGRSLTVKDTYAGGPVFHQFWHLDPGWVLRSRSADGRRLTFAAGTNTLIVTTAGSTAVVRGSTRHLGGWSFSHSGTKVRAAEIRVRGIGSVTTTFRVV
jgi:hypothetical protein